MANTTYDTIKNMKPAAWSKSTVADGNALNQNFLEPTHQKDLALATAIDQVKNTVDGYNETINDISNVANAAKTQATNAISAANEAQDDVEALSVAVNRHGESIETLDINFNTLSAAVATEAEAISNLQNNKQDKIYVDANTISGNGTQDSPYTVIGGNQKELEFADSTTVTVHKDEQDDKIIYSFSAAGGGGGGTSYDYAWVPTVDQYGNISWRWDEYTAAPESQNIKGPDGDKGDKGDTGAAGQNGTSVYLQSVETVVGGKEVTLGWGTSDTSAFVIPSGIPGTPGTPGTNGYSPLVSTTTTAAGNKTGTVITFTYGDQGSQTTSYTAWDGEDGAGATNYFDSTTISGAGTQASEYGLKTDAAMYLPNTSAHSATYAEQYWDEVEHNYLTISNVVNYLDTTKIDIPTGTGYENKTWLYHTSGNNGWVEANSWLCNHFICENGISGIPDMSDGIMHFGLSADYLPLSGGTVSGSTYFSAANGKNMVAVASAATLIGASRQTSANFGQNNNALGTTWVGVGGAGMYRGFLKYTQGGNVGDLDSDNTMQVEFTPSNKGTIFAKAKNSGNDCPETQILNPTKASCDAMSQSANANLVSGPNYMLAKNADGQFVIGAACINCTDINNVTLAPNTYYFVYEV